MIFVSYSHKDKRWLERLRVHLQPLVRTGRVDIWDDSRIAVGDHWRSEIAKALDASTAAILLISADFLASRFVADHELPTLLQAQSRRGLRVLPLLVSPSRYSETPEIAKFQAINSPSRPLSAVSRAEAERVLVALTQQVESLYLPESSGTVSTGPHAIARSGGVAQLAAGSTVKGNVTVLPSLLDIEAVDAKQVFERVVAAVGDVLGFDRRRAVDGLIARERIGATALGHGIAIPHVSMPGLRQTLLLFARLREPIPFRAADDLPVSIFLCYFITKPEHDHAYMLSLNRLAGVLADVTARDWLHTVSDPTLATERLQVWSRP